MDEHNRYVVVALQSPIFESFEEAADYAEAKSDFTPGVEFMVAGVICSYTSSDGDEQCS